MRSLLLTGVCILMLHAWGLATPADDLAKIVGEIAALDMSPQTIAAYRQKLLDVERAAAGKDNKTAAEAVYQTMSLIDATQALPELKDLMADLNKKYPDQKSARGVAYVIIGHRLRFVADFAGSTEHFEKAIELLKDSGSRAIPSSYATMASNYWKQGQTEKSFEIYRMVVDTYATFRPDVCAKCLAEMQMQYNRLGKSAEELAVCKELVEKFPLSGQAAESARRISEDMLIPLTPAMDAISLAYGTT